MPEFRFVVPWRETSGREGTVDVLLSAQHPREHYGEFPGDGETKNWERHAQIAAHCAASICAFMDVTGLEICHDYAQVFGEHYRMPDGADHTRAWQLKAEVGGRFFATSEPYHDGYKQVEEWCAAHGWTFHTFPKGIGFWFPAQQGTRLVLMVPPGSADVFPSIIAALDGRLPCWTQD
jgi:hypothetical protein